MKSNLLFLLAILLFLSFSCTDITSDDPGIITIHASKYNLDVGSNIPEWTDTFNITLYKMRNANLLDDIISSKELHSVTNGVFNFSADKGRYIVYASQDSLSGFIDFQYVEDNISFTLFLQ